MRCHRTAILGCAVLVYGACVNPAPSAPDDDAGNLPPGTQLADCAGPAAAGAEAPAATPPPLDDADADADAADSCSIAAIGCNATLAGWYGLAYDLDVVYRDDADDGLATFDPGRGRVRVVLKANAQDGCPGAGGGQSTFSLCALELPALTSAADGVRRSLTIPDATWDRPGVAGLSTAMHFTQLGSRARLEQEPLELLLGIAAPRHWPSYAETPYIECGAGQQGSACFPDDDADGEPGVTVQLSTDCQLAAVPEVGALYVGLRTQLRGGVALDGRCETGQGQAEADALELRVLDCKQRDGSACTAPQAEHADRHAPTFRVLHAGETPGEGLRDVRPSRGSMLTARRLGPAGAEPNCQEVRAALAD